MTLLWGYEIKSGVSVKPESCHYCFGRFSFFEGKTFFQEKVTFRKLLPGDALTFNYAKTKRDELLHRH